MAEAPPLRDGESCAHRKVLEDREHPVGFDRKVAVGRLDPVIRCQLVDTCRELRAGCMSTDVFDDRIRIDEVEALSPRLSGGSHASPMISRTPSSGRDGRMFRRTTSAGRTGESNQLSLVPPRSKTFMSASWGKRRFNSAHRLTLSCEVIDRAESGSTTLLMRLLRSFITPRSVPPIDEGSSGRGLDVTSNVAHAVSRGDRHLEGTVPADAPRYRPPARRLRMVSGGRGENVPSPAGGPGPSSAARRSGISPRRR